MLYSLLISALFTLLFTVLYTIVLIVNSSRRYCDTMNRVILLTMITDLRTLAAEGGNTLVSSVVPIQLKTTFGAGACWFRHNRMVDILDASGVQEQKPRRRMRRKRVAAAILPDGSRERISEVLEVATRNTPSCWPCCRLLCDVELDLDLRGCNAASCLSTSLVQFRLPYFISVLLRYVVIADAATRWSFLLL